MENVKSQGIEEGSDYYSQAPAGICGNAYSGTVSDTSEFSSFLQLLTLANSAYTVL